MSPDLINRIEIRFVCGADVTSQAIRFQAGVAMPFPPSHCEAVSLDGTWWIGQHLNGGMMKRRAGYDADNIMTLPDGRKAERFVTLPCTQEQQDAFYSYIESKLGQPYDWTSILDFVDQALNLHQFNHLICSAIMAAALRQEPHPYFPWPLTVPFHRLSPNMLFLMLSSHVKIDH